jgi:hypothetical protein
MPSSGRFRIPESQRERSAREQAYQDERARQQHMNNAEAERLAATEQTAFAPVDQEMQAAPAMVGVSGGTMGNAAERVTPVEIPRAIFTHPFQDTITVRLPYQSMVFSQGITAAAVRAASDVLAYTWRLNSPVDIATSYTYVADPTPSADTASGTQNSPMYWRYYSSLYRYYTVIKSSYKIYVRPSNIGGRRWSAWTYHHGNQGPPIMDASFVYPTDHYKGFHKHARCTPIVERSTASTIENSDWSERTISGEYYPGRYSVQNDVVEDDLTRTWHKVSDVPPLKELLTLIIHKSDFENNFSGTNFFDIKFEITYDVQFKDLYEQFAYPYLGTGLPAVTNYADQTN